MSDRHDDSIWFEQRRYGLGAGLPVAWQGWVLLTGFVAVMAIGGALLSSVGPGPRAALIAGMMIAAAGFIVLALRHTRGGWRWRWGGEE